ncbi:methyltransferase family protein [Hasllibacter halocynthiae]|uniref:Methyltransferase family protein n=1 Tax=Hasllibacter halocynthiae TaxID=595589 RepID=A0A2T0X7Q5_9RHOB|nr:methyltransferase domain-containing protein [Hasllibacter halocynthiae]PRY94981.1 methyltransferase family protein [Hasllibacter halocynthiae]
MAGPYEGAAFWDAKFAGPKYRFGTEPAAFLRDHADVIPPGARVLVPCDGEGRNSVWLAERGHAVTAFDVSPVGLRKARALARRRGARPELVPAGIDDWNWDQPFDAVVAVFVQFAGPDRRTRLFEEMARALRPGGVLLLHGYAPRQVGYGTGGPGAAGNLYTLPMLHEAFEGWDVLHEADRDAVIEEGDGHSGLSALIDFIGRKPRT